MDPSLIVINPNASASVTAAIDRAVTPLRRAGVPLRCVTSASGPVVIESQRDADLSIPPMLELAASLDADALGFVVACFSDPGVEALRTQVSVPVVGIREAAVSAALCLGRRFGVVAILEGSVQRQQRAFAAMGVAQRWAGSRALGLGVAELADPDRTGDRLRAVARSLRDDDGADVLILGCAGMADYRDALSDELGLPVVEPSQAAVTLALGRVLTDPARQPAGVPAPAA